MFEYLLFICILLTAASSDIPGDNRSLNVVAPTYVSIEDFRGNPLSSLVYNKYEKIETIFLKTNGTEVTWSFSPKLPTGLIFEEERAYIYGNSSEVISATQFTVTATNSAGKASSVFTLTINGCPYGDFHFPLVSSNLRVYLELYKGKQTFFSNYVSSTQSICIPRGTVSYYLNCTYSRDKVCSFQLEDEKHNYYLTRNLRSGEKMRGEFETVVTQAPVIRFPSILSAFSLETIFKFSQVDGIHSGLSVQSLPDGFTFDSMYGTLSGRAVQSGLSSFTITAKNTAGETKLPVTLAVDACPEGTEFLKIIRKEDPSYDTVLLSDAAGVSIYDLVFADNKTYSHLCLKEGTYSLYMEPAYLTSWKDTNPIYFYRGDDIIAQFDKPKYDGSETRQFALSLPIKKESTYAFSFSAGSKWTSLKYKDSDWKKGSTGKWGSFSPSSPTVYFRKLFEVADVSKYSVFHLNLMASDSTKVYLNDQLIIETSTHDRFDSFTFPVSVLQDGKNILAVEMTSSLASKTIGFDVEMVLTTSGCLVRSVDGLAEDSPHSSSSFSVQNAFDLDPSTFWVTNRLPVTAKYTFKNNAKHVVNRVLFMLGGTNNLFSFRIEGIEGMNNVTLYQHTRDSPYPMDDILYFTFSNDHAYSSYQIVFEEGLYNFGLNVYEIRFLTCNPLSCNKKWGLDKDFMDAVVYKSCPLGSTGTKQVICRNIDNEPTWVEDKTACLKKYPSKGYAHIDWSAVFYNVTSAYNTYLMTNFKEMIRNQLPLQKDEVNFYFIRDLSIPVMKMIQVDIRFTVEVEIGDYMIKHLKKMIANFDELVKKHLSGSSKDISGAVINGPALINPINYFAIISISLIVILVLAAFIYYLRIRVIPRNQSGTKSLLRLKKTEDSTSLLQTQV